MYAYQYVELSIKLIPLKKKKKAFKSYQAGDNPNNVAADSYTQADTHKLVFVTTEDMAFFPGDLTLTITTTCLNPTLTRTKFLSPNGNRVPIYENMLGDFFLPHLN